MADPTDPTTFSSRTLEQLKEEEKQSKRYIDNLRTEKELRAEINQLKRDEAAISSKKGDLTDSEIEADLIELDRLKEKIDLLERTNDRIKINRAEELRALADIQAQIAFVTDLRQKNNSELKEELQSLNERVEAAQRQFEADRNNIDNELELGALRKKALIAEQRLAEKTEGTSETTLRNLQKQIDSQEEANKKLEITKRLIEGIGDEADDSSKSLSNFVKSLLKMDFGGAAKSAGELKGQFGALRSRGLSSTQAIGKLSGGMGKFLKVGGAVIGVLGLVAVGYKMFAGGVAKTATQLADSRNEAAKVVGGNQELAKSVTNAFKETRKFGASAEDTGKSFDSLSKSMSNFTLESDSSREKILKQTTVLEKLGVDSKATATNIQLLTKSMGMTGDKASDVTLELAALGKDLGIDPAQLAKDFGSAGGQLAKLGSDGVQAFKRLAVASKATGLEIGKILNLVEKFDTFEGAATQAGKLNAALGGNFVNAMELLTATDPVERFNMIRDSILDAGLTFDEMSYFQRKFFTDAAGLSDVSELAMMLSGDMDTLSGEVGKTSADYAEAAKRAKDLAKFQEKLQTAAQNLIPVVEPLVDGLNDFANSLNESTAPDRQRQVSKFFGIVGAGLTAIGVAAGLALGFTLGPIAAIVAGIGAIGVALFQTSFNPDSLFLGIKEMTEDFDGMSVNINKTTKSMHSFGNEAVSTGNKTYQQAQLTQKVLPEVMKTTNSTVTNEINKNQINNAMLGSTTATTNALSSVVRNSTNNTTINQNGKNDPGTSISIKFDNKKMADLFDVQVEKSLGRTARRAAQGG